MEERYELRSQVGEGGLGSVHRAFDHKLQREVAIKRIHVSDEDPDLEQEATKQILTEARALAALQNPHIVTILDVGSDELGPYLVMELLSGINLHDLIKKSPLSLEDFREVVSQSLKALIAAQELGMIHCDLKPQNIMLTWLPSGEIQVKILDFGLAALIKSQSQEEVENMDSTYGSIYFMPPELFDRKTLDERSDLYSLGCCFYQALTGQYPCLGNTSAEVIEAHFSNQIIPIDQFREDVPQWIQQWVFWLLCIDRKDRPSTARDALTAFIQSEQNMKKAELEESVHGHGSLGPRIMVSTVPMNTPSRSLVEGSSYKITRNTPHADDDEDQADEDKSRPADFIIMLIFLGLLGGILFLLEHHNGAISGLLEKLKLDHLAESSGNEASPDPEEPTPPDASPQEAATTEEDLLEKEPAEPAEPPASQP